VTGTGYALWLYQRRAGHNNELSVDIKRQLAAAYEREANEIIGYLLFCDVKDGGSR
jgi:hypothetical protein